MAKFKVGDKVRVKVFDKRPSHWHSAGRMDCWMGKVVTIRSIGTYYTKIIEDEDAFHENVAAGWDWKESDFETIPAREFIVIRRSGAETIAELRHDREVIKSARATCAPSDTFDLDTGAKIAFDRLMGREADQAMPRCKMARADEYETHFRPSKEAAERSIFKIGDRVVDLLLAYGEGTVVGFERDIGHDWTWVKFDDPVGIRPRRDLNIKPAPQPAHRFKVGDRVAHPSFGVGTIIKIRTDIAPEIPYLVKFADEEVWVSEPRLCPAPAPEPPKFYTGKVVCVGIKDAYSGYKLGMVIEIDNGVVVSPEDFQCRGTHIPYSSFKHFSSQRNHGLWCEVKSDVH